MSLLIRLAIFFCLLIIAVCAGLYLGKISVPDEPSRLARPAQPPAPPPGAASTDSTIDPPSDILEQPPLFLHVGHDMEEDWSVIGEQVMMAAEAGIDKYIVPISLGWDVEARDAAAERYQRMMERYISWNNRARIMLSVDLNPSVPWFEHHSEAAMRIEDAFLPYPTPTSSVWLAAARDALGHLISSIESGPYSEHITGYILGALEGRHWQLSEQYDVSEANKQGFLHWLRRRYGSDDAVMQRWALEDSTLALAIPQVPDTNDLTQVFFGDEEMYRHSDYLRYTSESVADALASFASFTAQTSTLAPTIGAFYGFSMETTSNASGQFALTSLLESDLNALFSPVSYVDRGLGGVGGMMGAIDSWTMRGKDWYLVDDTRTGVERDEETGAFSRIKGIRAEDVYEVQRRNFAMALTYGLGLVWSDPRAEGWLYDAEQWQHLGELKEIYVEYLASATLPLEEHPTHTAKLTVVVDEDSRFYQQCAAPVNSTVLIKARDAVLRSGVSTRFHLLRDVIEGNTPPSPVYLFLNAFYLDEEDRSRLHSRLAQEQASVIWMYAPGYITDKKNVENIAATTGMDVRIFEEPTATGSSYLLTGQHMHSEQAFGSGEIWDPLFYVAPEENTDFIARYVDEPEKGSVAILTLPEGWTSVYIADPELSAPLLSEILRLLEQHLYLNPVERPYYDAIFARNDIVALHAGEAGKRALFFGYFCDSEDLLDPAIGWLQKDNIILTMRTGETRVLQHRPIFATEEP